ncbi:MAG: T9SS type A sorting domain-containing protein [Bacteroidota bacterium]
MKKILLIITTALSMALQGQNKATLVEHFTNTLCSVCSSRNPGLYQNLRAQQDILHIAYHPSAPYTGCILNQHNKVENDAKTNYYGVYGSTPRIVINGIVQSASTYYANASIFNPFKNIAADVSILVKQTVEGDLIKSTVSVKRLTSAVLNNLKLHVMYVEDTLFYNAPNGENQHYDVFRKAASNIQGVDITLPNNIDDSLVVLTQTTVNSAWNKNRMYTLAFVQNANDKTILNAAKSNALKSNSTGINGLQDIGVQLFPNPAGGVLYISLNSIGLNKISITNMLGSEVLNTTINDTDKLDLTGFSKGVYFISIENALGKTTQKLLIK